MPKIPLTHTRNNGGFTLAELLVASVIVLIATAAVVAVVRKGAEIQVNGVHRLRARNVIMGYFENDFDYRRFSKDDPPGYGVVVGGENVLIPADGEWKPGPAGAEIVLGGDGADGGVPAFRGRMFFRAQAGSRPIGGYSVPCHEIAIKVKWAEAGGEEDSIVLAKLLADTREE